MSAIEAATAGYRGLADGTLRLTLDIEPRHRAAALALFAEPGRAVAIAALKDGQGAAPPEPPLVPARAEEKPPRVHLGDLCWRAVMWGKDEEFRAWLGVQTEDEAADTIRALCNVESRKQLDTDPRARARFDERIRGPFNKHLVARGIVR